jgi:hypothetical protein
MQLRTRARILTGEPVIVSFFEPHDARWYDLEATVARVAHGRRRRDGERAIGLRFESIDEDARESLRSALEASAQHRAQCARAVAA